MTLPADERDDAALVCAARGGEDRAFAVLTDRHKDGLYRFIRAYVGDADEALDLVQESFVAAWSALARFDTGRPFGTWARRIALNKCRDWSRRRRVRNFFYGAVSIDAKGEANFAESVEPDAQAGALARLDTAIALLPPPLKEPLLLTMFDALSHKDAGAVLGLSAKAVESRIYRAKQILARALADRDEESG
jgi:RNA polymerase sigma-70 factor (ECF subfamily)